MNIPLSSTFRKVTQKFSSIEDLLENIKANFEVEKREVYFLNNNEDNHLNYPDYNVIVRKDNQAPLSVVSSRYEVIQYKDGLSFVNEILNLNQAELAEGFVIDNGARVFIMLKATESVKFNNNEDIIESYFTVSSSHDSSNSLTVMATPIHKATSTIITPTSNGFIKLRHTVHVKDKMFEAHKIISKMKNYFNETSENFTKMAKVQLTPVMLSGYLKQVFPGESTRSENVRAKISDIFKTNSTINSLSSSKNTLLGAYVAVLIYCDYYSVLRESTKKSPAEQRIEASLVGSAAKTKAEGFSVVLNILKDLGI